MFKRIRTNAPLARDNFQCRFFFHPLNPQRENFIFMRFFERADLSSHLRCNESNKRKTGNKRENKTWKNSPTFLFTIIFLPGQPYTLLRLLGARPSISCQVFGYFERGKATQAERKCKSRIVYAIHFGGGRSFVTEDFVLELISVESYGRVKVNWSFGLIVLFQIVFLIRICSNVNQYKI